MSALILAFPCSPRGTVAEADEAGLAMPPSQRLAWQLFAEFGDPARIEDFRRALVCLPANRERAFQLVAVFAADPYALVLRGSALMRSLPPLLRRVDPAR